MVKTAVLIDDDREDLDFLEEAIKQIDHSIKCISYLFSDDAVHRIKTVSSPVPDFIFIDMDMPRMSGSDCLKELRRDPKLKDALITMLSSSMPPPVSKMLKDNGADFTFQKPNRLDDYLPFLERILLM